MRSVADPMGNITTYAYNGLNQRTRAADPAGNTTTFRYDPAGSLLAVVDPMQGETVFAYDPMGRKTSETLPGNTSPRTYLYSVAGDLRVATDENGVATTATHDALGRTLSQRVGDGNPTLYAYDAAGNTVRVTDPEGRVTETFHDGLNRPSLVVEPLGRTTSYGYDGNGNRDSILALNGFDAANGTQFETVFVYDELNRLAEHVFPDATPGVPTDNDRYVYGYDAAGRVRRTVTPNGAVVTQVFDELGRLEQRSLPGHEYRFTHTPDSLPANSQHTDTARNETWSVAYAYDSRRLPVAVTETHPGLPARTFAYTHDAAGRRDSAALASGRTESFALDAQGRTTGVATVFATTAGDRAASAAFVYDAAGRQTAKSYAGGAMTRSYAYDGRNRLLAVAGTRADGFNLLSHEYRYRESGNRSYAKRGWDLAGGGSVCTADVYEYDALYRVVDTKYGVAATPTAGTVGPANQPAAIDFATATAAFRQELKLDLLANRVEFAQTGTDPSSLAYGGYNGTAATSYVPDPRCRTASVDDGSGAVSPVWDANGALTDDGVRLYEYDPENRLLGVSPKSPAAGDLRAAYAYDALGRRARRTVEEFDGAAWGPLSETHYFHDGWSVVEEVDGATGAVVAEYLNGRGLDEPLAAVLAGVNGGEPVYFHQDHLGSVELLTDAAGNVLQRYRYDIHGNATVLDAAGNVLGGPDAAVSPYLFAGRRFDIESGLYYVRNRYYSPLLGKFISPDPLDYVDGMNVYAYVNGNVVNLVDPMGLEGNQAAPPGTKRGPSPSSWRTQRPPRRHHSKPPQQAPVPSNSPGVQPRVAPIAPPPSGSIPNAPVATDVARRWLQSDPLYLWRTTIGAPSPGRPTPEMLANGLSDMGYGMVTIGPEGVPVVQPMSGEAAAYSRFESRIREEAQSLHLHGSLTEAEADDFVKRHLEAYRNNRKAEKSARNSSPQQDNPRLLGPEPGHLVQVDRTNGTVTYVDENGGLATVSFDQYRKLYGPLGVGQDEVASAERAGRLETGANEAVFWSGIRDGQSRAAAWVAQNGGSTLETIMNSRGITLPPWDASNPTTVAAWRKASAEFAAGAKGDVRVLQGDAIRIKSVWAEVEFPALKENPNVNSITSVNPDTGEKVIIWSR